MLEKNDKFEQYHIIMMSDGESCYPKEEVSEIVKMKEVKKIKFSAIGYGEYTDFEILEQIAEELGGSLVLAADEIQLKQSFIRLAPNAYEPKG